IEASEMINSQSASFQEEIQKIKDIRNSISIEEINELSNINRNSLIKSEAERIKTRLLALEEEVSKADITVRNKYREMIDDYTVYITDQYLNEPDSTIDPDKFRDDVTDYINKYEEFSV